MHFFEKQKEKFINSANDHEDYIVVDFLNQLDNGKQWDYLEVGSGLGRFPIKIKKIFAKLNIECLEVNPDLAKVTESNNLKTTISNAVNLPYSDNSFDILHCSHVIEHFKYPDVARFLDELVRVTKNNGYIIIRSPLMHPGFYLDIDHVRPYPPETIFNYFKNEQQQIVGHGRIKAVKIWYRKENARISNIGLSKTKYFINALLALSWTYVKFPFSKKNGYILILQKLSNN